MPARLRFKRIWRRLPPVRACKIVTQIISHPANEEDRARAVVRSVAWQIRSRLKNEPVDVEVYGQLRLRCYPRSGSASNVFYFTPYYDFDEMNFVRRYLEPGDYFVDAGANIGTYTLLAASCVGPTGLVHSFEPAPLAAGRLRENVALNGLDQVVVHEAAVGRKPARVPMLASSDVSNTLVPAPGKVGRPVEVDVVRLDDVVGDRQAQLIKVDVEGYELEALQGAERVLTTGSPPVLLIEIIEHLLVRATTSPGKVRVWLKERGYELFRYEARTVELRAIPEGAGLNGNYLAIKADCIDRVRLQVTGRR